MSSPSAFEGAGGCCGIFAAGFLLAAGGLAAWRLFVALGWMP